MILRLDITESHYCNLFNLPFCVLSGGIYSYVNSIKWLEEMGKSTCSLFGDKSVFVKEICVHIYSNMFVVFYVSATESVTRARVHIIT